MKKFYKFSSFLFILIIIHSCKSNPVNPIESIVNPSSEYHQISITQTDYNSFEISDNSNFILSSKNISSVILGDINSGVFSGKDTLQPIYEPTGDKFKLKFKFNETIDDTVLIYRFSLRYLFIDSENYDLDTFKITYKYPYQSTEILLKWSKLSVPPIPDYPYPIQAFDIVDFVLYYHPYGPYGLYKYNLNTEQTNLLFDYSSGNYITATSNFVFCDVDNVSIYRYNLDSNKVDKKIIGKFQHIDGVANYENKLYVLDSNEDLSIYNFDLQLESTLTFPLSGGFSLTIKNDTAYCNNIEKIIKVNLTTLDTLPSIKIPTSRCDAITIIGDKMYFTDYDKHIICSVDISELK